MPLIFVSVSADLLFVVAVLIGIIYWYYIQIFKFWEEKGLSVVKPIFPVGNIGRLVTFQASIGEVMQDLYFQLKNTGPFAGFYISNRPGLLVNDPEMIKTVLVRDFNFFHDRGVYYNEKYEPISANLFTIEGIKWRNLRVKLSPVFTSGKMKQMFPIMLEISEEFAKYMEQNVASNPEMEIKDSFARFTTDMIGSCAFGIKCNSLTDPNSEFKRKGCDAFATNVYHALKTAFLMSFKEISVKLGIRYFNKSVTDFFMGVVKDTVSYREKYCITRNDVMQLLIQLKNKGKLDDDHSESDIKLEALTLNEVAAQAFLFFLAGFETSSTTMSFATYELALRSDIQEKAREEIEKVYSKHGGHLTYDGLHELTYLDMIIYETLRKYPVLPILVRQVAKDYILPGTSTVIPAGTPTLVPVLGLHHDPEYYPEPDKFDPLRFTEDKKQERHPFTYLPFGAGPRNCIGMRFGMMQTRLGLIVLIKNYKIELTERTSVPLKINHKSFLTASVGGIWVKLTPLGIGKVGN